jgi:hypothetical protein
MTGRLRWWLLVAAAGGAIWCARDVGDRVSLDPNGPAEQLEDPSRPPLRTPSGTASSVPQQDRASNAGGERRALDSSSGAAPSPTPRASVARITVRDEHDSLTEFVVLLARPNASAPVPRTVDDGSLEIPLEDLPCRVLALGGGSFTDELPLTAVGEYDLSTKRLVDVRGEVREAESEAPIASAEVRLDRTDLAQEWRGALQSLGVDMTPTATTSTDGAYLVTGVPVGTYELTATSPSHDASSVTTTDDSAPLIRLTLRRAIPVRLHGIDLGRPEDYSVGTSPVGTRYPVDRTGMGRLLLDAGLPGPDVTVFYPDDTELTAIFLSPPADLSAGLDVNVGGAEVATVTLHTAGDVDERYILCVQFTSARGYDAFATRWITAREPERLTFCEPGVVWFDVTTKRSNGTLQALARERVELRAGVPVHVALELTSAPCHLRFVDAAGAPLVDGEVYLATESDSHLSPVGGALDANGRALVPVRTETELHLIGSLGPHAAALVDVPVSIDPRHTTERIVDVGKLERASVTLVEEGKPVAGRVFDLVGAATQLVVSNHRTGPEGEAAELAWYSAGDPTLRLDAWDLWSPRGLLPLLPGTHRIDIVRRAHCTFRTRGRAVVDVRHFVSGLALEQLLQHEGVRTEEIPTGRRLWGPPCGTYEVRLEGEAHWRGPFVVAPGDWVIVDVDE